MNNTLGFAILWRSVRTRHPEKRAMGEQEGAGGGVIKLAPVVTLDGLDSAAELDSNIGEKIGQSVIHVRFKFEREGPQIMSEIIKKNQIVFITRHANNWGCPQIKMQQLKRFKSMTRRIGKRQPSVFA